MSLRPYWIQPSEGNVRSLGAKLQVEHFPREKRQNYKTGVVKLSVLPALCYLISFIRKLNNWFPPSSENFCFPSLSYFCFRAGTQLFCACFMERTLLCSSSEAHINPLKARFQEEIKGWSEGHFIFRGREKEHHFVRRFLGYTRSSFW
jgi:hypothetical protein